MASGSVNALFASGPQAKIIDWLYVSAKPSESFSPRELARRAGVPYGSTGRALKDLVARQLIVREETDRGPRYRAPFDDPRWKYLFLLLRQDSVIVSKLKRALKSFKSVEYACIFGSFARGTTHKESDVDVLVLENSEEERFKILTALSKVSDAIGREANGQFYSVDEFRDNAKKGEAVALSILNTSRIPLKGELQL